MIENPRSGEQIDFLVDTPDLLRMRSTWSRPGHRAPPHLHPRMEEQFHVEEGWARFRVGGRVVDAVAGGSVVVPPGVVHLGWNPTQLPVTLIIEMRPALRWRAFTEMLFAGEDPDELLRAHGAEIELHVEP